MWKSHDAIQNYSIRMNCTNFIQNVSCCDERSSAPLSATSLKLFDFCGKLSNCVTLFITVNTEFSFIGTDSEVLS